MLTVGCTKSAAELETTSQNTSSFVRFFWTRLVQPPDGCRVPQQVTYVAGGVLGRMHDTAYEYP